MPDVETELDRLAGEKLALELLFVGLCNSLIQLNPDNRTAVEAAFVYAENITTSGAVKLGKMAAPAHTLGAVSLVEKLRAGIITNGG